MNMEIIQNAATEVLVNLALGVITLAGASKLKAQTAQITDTVSRKLLEDAVADVASLATLSVNAMEQTTARALRDAVKSGTKDREELLALSTQVFDEVKAAIAPEAQEVISANLGSFDTYLTKCIEDAVLKVKQADPFLTLPESMIVDGIETSAQKAAENGE